MFYGIPKITLLVNNVNYTFTLNEQLQVTLNGEVLETDLIYNFYQVCFNTKVEESRKSNFLKPLQDQNIYFRVIQNFSNLKTKFILCENLVFYYHYKYEIVGDYCLGIYRYVTLINIENNNMSDPSFINKLICFKQICKIHLGLLAE